MRIIAPVAGMKDALRAERARERTVGLVPTMGYLHEGHLSLVRASRAAADVTVASVFVNPAQFGPKEDFKTYPRDLERDAEMLRAEGTDYLFLPAAEEIYPAGYKTYVEVHDLQDLLCGASRPGHFRGVCTVVLKLFEIVRPDVAFFGQKDAQQAIILKRMARDLNLDIRVEVRPIVREPDGLAMSSRNAYLDPDERRAALVLWRSLTMARELIAAGERRSSVILGEMRAMIDSEPRARLDYVEAVETEGLTPVSEAVDGTLIALAVFIGRTRLIDNLIVGS
jgi:pantoate--beta-alanine ligase